MASRVTRLLLHRRLATAAEASARRAPQAPCAGAAVSKVIQQQRWRKTLNPSKPPPQGVRQNARADLCVASSGVAACGVWLGS